ncbi:hypothetical protein L6452_42476 [Arctium lappa]|uniref:Uncharacterized protein n=1 Tax=Arctium lappa TaxID=4217 RepID=A0ACB8XIU9_ARCLA|nr:hypothetical protein L6452_42476 [Arctium lappa]
MTEAKVQNCLLCCEYYCDTVTSDMKTAIKSVVAELLPVLVARPLEFDFMPGARIVDNDGGGFVLLPDTILRIVQVLREFWVDNEELVEMYNARLGDAGYINFKLPSTNGRGDGLLIAGHKDYFHVIDHRD